VEPLFFLASLLLVAEEVEVKEEILVVTEALEVAETEQELPMVGQALQDKDLTVAVAMVQQMAVAVVAVQVLLE